MRYMIKNDVALFYLCSLIEFIGRKQKQKRGEVVQMLGKEALHRIYKYADVLHCEPIERVAEEYIEMCKILSGDFDNVSHCRYEVPDYWTIGEVYERLIEDVCTGDVLEKLQEVYLSWIDERISNYNTDFFYQPRDYIYECYIEGSVL